MIENSARESTSSKDVGRSIQEQASWRGEPAFFRHAPRTIHASWKALPRVNVPLVPLNAPSTGLVGLGWIAPNSILRAARLSVRGREFSGDNAGIEVKPGVNVGDIGDTTRGDDKGMRAGD